MRISDLNSKKSEILELAEKFGVSNIRLFGSTAAGTSDEMSDVDFLVDVLPQTSIFDLGGLQMEFERLLGCRVDVVTENGLRERIRKDVLKQAISL